LGSHTSRLAGIAVRRSDVGASETVTRRGHPTTSRVRTLADLGRHLPLVEAVAALDMALHRRLLKSDDLRSWVCAHPRYPGVAHLRRAIELAEPATESVMETRLRLLLVLGRLPRPHAQISLYDEFGDFLARPDFYYPHQRLALEYDGSTHRENLTGDNRRQNRLVDAGYRLLRFTAADVLSAPDSVVALVRRALAAESSSVLPIGLNEESIPSFPHTRRRPARAISVAAVYDYRSNGGVHKPGDRDRTTAPG
jgi:very-short-patch-repair endonuclease